MKGREKYIRENAEEGWREGKRETTGDDKKKRREMMEGGEMERDR